MLIIDRTRDKAVALPDSHSFASVPKICYKSEKVSDDTSSGDRISGNDSQFKGNNYHSFTERFTINKKMCQYLYQNPQTTFRADKSVRSPDINSFGHCPCKTPLSFSPATTNSGSKKKWYLQKSSVNKQGMSNGASLVVEKHRNIQRKVLNLTSSPSSFIDRLNVKIKFNKFLDRLKK